MDTTTDLVLVGVRSINASYNFPNFFFTYGHLPPPRTFAPDSGGQQARTTPACPLNNKHKNTDTAPRTNEHTQAQAPLGFPAVTKLMHRICALLGATAG